MKPPSSLVLLATPALGFLSWLRSEKATTAYTPCENNCFSAPKCCSGVLEAVPPDECFDRMWDSPLLFLPFTFSPPLISVTPRFFHPLCPLLPRVLPLLPLPRFSSPVFRASPSMSFGFYLIRQSTNRVNSPQEAHRLHRFRRHLLQGRLGLPRHGRPRRGVLHS